MDAWTSAQPRVAIPRDRPTGCRAFHRGLPGYGTTPVVDLPELARELGVARILVKDESRRFHLGAFKALGASWAVAQELARRGGIDPTSVSFDDVVRLAAADQVHLVTATDGNHGRAVAWLARLLDLRATVVVPAVMSDVARARITSEGAQLLVVDGDYDDAVAAAAHWAGDHRRAVLIQDTAWDGYEQVPQDVVDGYSTLFSELDEQAGPDLALVAVPVGVGSLLQAAVEHYRSLARSTAVVSVEPTTAACVLASLSADRLVSVPTADTSMAGLNCGTPSSLAWPVVRAGLDGAVAVSDEQTDRAIAVLAAGGVASGPSGAASVAGLVAAFTGPDGDRLRKAWGVDAGSTLVALSTEGPVTA